MLVDQIAAEVVGDMVEAGSLEELNEPEQEEDLKKETALESADMDQPN